MACICRTCIDLANVGLYAPAVAQQEQERPQLGGGTPRSCEACGKRRPCWASTPAEVERARLRGPSEGA